ncbi:MAG TPA: RHS repeat-associated core domain-containing protein [Terriglobia bacterium]|nr:RHS repeat-associated core domain-containing protein [Terriglobia bacterium]
MVRLNLRLATILTLFLFAVSTAHAQVATGIPPFGSFGGGPDIVDNASLNVLLAVPVLKKAGRGMPFNYSLNYNSSIWSPYSSGVYGAWSPSGSGSSIWGWTPESAGETGNYDFTQTQVCCPGQHCNPNQGTGTYYNKYTQWVYIDPTGTGHAMPSSVNVNDSSHICPPGTGSWSATGTTADGSGWTMTVDASPEATFAYDTDGRIIDFVNSKITDSNGNTITNNGSSYSDTLGLTALSISGSGTQSSPQVYTYTGPSGAVTVTVRYTNFNIKTNFGCSGVTEANFSNIPLVTEIDLPENTKYTFSYEGTVGSSGYTTGRLASITLPTGGKISYDYGNSPQHNTITCADGSVYGLTRTVYPDGVTPQAWTYTRTFGSTASTTIQDPQGNQTVIDFQGIYETERKLYQGSTSGTLLATVDTCYNGATIPCTGTAIGLPISNSTTQTTIPNLSPAKTYVAFNSNSLPTERDEYDYGPTLVRKAMLAYCPQGGNAYCPQSLYTNHVYDRVYQTQVFDGGNTLRAQANNTFDNNGNLVVETHVNTGGSPSAITRYFNYSSTAPFGVLQNSTDFNSNYTHYDNGSFACSSAYPTSIKPPIIPATNLTWDCNGATTTQVTDANSQPTNFYYDSMWRLTGTGYADGGSTNADFSQLGSTPPTIGTSVQVTSGVFHGATTTLDGLGRTIHSSDNNTGAVVDTTYDSLGLIHSVSNPYISTSEPTYGLTVYAYDALGRVTGITYPDNNTASVSYTGACATSTDAQSKARKICTDGLGRTTSVTEDPSGLNYSTTYTYDVLNNLTGVTQGSQTRTYVYDMLSRLTSATTPESGATTFIYDANGNVVTRTAPKPNQTNPNVTVTTTYAYDGLNRLTSKSYSDGTAAANFFYDVSTPNIPNWNGGSLGHPVGRLAYTCTAPQVGSCASLSTATVTGYDAVGRVADLWQCTPFNCSTPAVWNTHNTYDLAGDVTNWTHPSGTSITYVYNSAQQITTVNDSISDATHPGLIASATYNSIGALATLTNGCVGTNCVQTQMTYSYNKRLQPVMMELGTAGSPAANYCQVYNYYSGGVSLTGCSLPGQGTGNNGNLMGSYLVEGASGYAAQNHQATYTYDGVNRLLSATAKTLGGSPTTLWSQSYLYDRFGNMSCSGSGICAVMTFNTSTNRLATLGNQPVTYDAAGNLTQDGNIAGTYRQYSFDAEGHVTKQTDVSGNVENDVYNAQGRMVESLTPSYQEEDFYDAFGMGIAAWCRPSNNWCGPEIHLGAGGMILGWDAFAPGPSAQTQFQHKDALGSTRLINDHAGTPQGDQLFYPWGDMWSVQGTALDPDGFAGFLGSLDTDGVLYDTLNRKYPHTMGRWLTPDPLAGDITNPQSLNRYAYVLNSPCSLGDPLGLDASTCNVHINNKTGQNIDVAGIEATIKQILDASSLGQSNQVGVSFDTGGKVDFTLTYNNNGVVGKESGNARPGGSTGQVFANLYPTSVYGQYTGTLMGVIGAHEMGHALANVPDQPNEGVNKDTLMSIDNNPGWMTPQNPVYSPNFPAGLLFTPDQVQAIFSRCPNKHPSVIPLPLGGGGGPGGAKGSVTNGNGLFWWWGAWANWWIFGSSVPSE